MRATSRHRRRSSLLRDAELAILKAETVGLLVRSSSYKANTKGETALAALCALGLWGLSARAISAISIGDVLREKDWGLVDQFKFAAVPGAADAKVRIPDADRWLLARHIRWRLSCPHFRLPLRTVRFELFDERCHACGEPLEAPKCPLFVSRFATPLSAKDIRLKFAALRTRLGIRPKVTFGSLRRTARALGFASTAVAS